MLLVEVCAVTGGVDQIPNAVVDAGARGPGTQHCAAAEGATVVSAAGTSLGEGEGNGMRNAERRAPIRRAQELVLLRLMAGTGGSAKR